MDNFPTINQYKEWRRVYETTAVQMKDENGNIILDLNYSPEIRLLKSPDELLYYIEGFGNKPKCIINSKKVVTKKFYYYDSYRDGGYSDYRGTSYRLYPPNFHGISFDEIWEISWNKNIFRYEAKLLYYSRCREIMEEEDRKLTESGGIEKLFERLSLGENMSERCQESTKKE